MNSKIWSDFGAHPPVNVQAGGGGGGGGIVQPGMYFQKLKFSVTFDPNAVYTSFFYHTIALEILYPSIYFLCPRLAQKASFEDTRQFR